MKYVITIAALILSSCSTVKKYQIGEDTYYQVSCNGTARSFMDCRADAHKICADEDKEVRGYDQEKHTIVGSNAGQIQTGLKRSFTFLCIEKSPEPMVGQ